MSIRAQEAATEKRREQFISDFTQNAKYMQLRDRLKQAIYRLAVEKFKKQMGPNPLSQGEKDKFKASLYIFLQKKMHESLAEAMARTNIHPDLAK
jgi:hypothetical protein